MKFSIITVCKNAEIAIERTILSVVSQTYNNIEYIIVDGASTDGTLDIIKKYEKEVSSRHASTCPEFIEGRFTLHYISEPDTGIYNAMNKGIKMATGDYLLFLNAGDYLIHYNVIINIQKVIDENSDTYDIIHGKSLFIDVFSGKCFEYFGSKKPDFKVFFNRAMPHSAIFYNRNLFEKHGYYNENYKIVSDTIFNKIVFCDKNNKSMFIDLVFSAFFLDGISSSQNDKILKIHEDESNNFINNYFTNNEIKIGKKYSEHMELVEKRRRKKSLLRFLYKQLYRIYIIWINR